ncbi:MAG: hypothetical protein ACYTG6_10195 [Planctomycetota bacterium]|jgi:hypothetical protein
MEPSCRSLLTLVLSLALVVAGGCGNSGREPAESGLAVAAITGPLATDTPTPFTITGNQFISLFGERVTVRFTSFFGTPFEGPSEFADVEGLVTSNTTVVGVSPVTTTDQTEFAFVTVILDSGAAATSAEPIAVFEVPDAMPLLRVVGDEGSTGEAE